MRLLIAEDQRDLTEALTFLFEKNQFTVDAVYDGRSAYDYAVAGSYDAIILDVMMPGLDQGRSSGGPGGVHRLSAVRLTAAKNVGIIPPG